MTMCDLAFPPDNGDCTVWDSFALRLQERKHFRNAARCGPSTEKLLLDSIPNAAVIYGKDSGIAKYFAPLLYTFHFGGIYTVSIEQRSIEISTASDFPMWGSDVRALPFMDKHFHGTDIGVLL